MAGGALAYVGYTNVLLTIMRKQKFLLYGMIFISLLALVGFGHAVQSGGMMGVSVYYLIIMVILVVYNVICINLFIHKVKNESEVNHPSDS
jgi:O-antigen/teichoic acid export membrane protein